MNIMNSYDTRNLSQHLSDIPIQEIGDIPQQLQLYDDGDLSVYYAPFDTINHDAKVVIVGLTPGFSQARESYAKYVTAVRSGMPHDEAARTAKGDASFAGSMRTNLISMLDGIGLPEAIGVESSEELFSSRTELLHATSALRYPVFRKEKNYSGNPHPTRHPVLRSMVEKILAPELASLRSAVIIPLGKAVSTSLELLAYQNRINSSQCLIGFPHPSGANGHRANQYARNRVDLSHQVKRMLAN